MGLFLRRSGAAVSLGDRVEEMPDVVIAGDQRAWHFELQDQQIGDQPGLHIFAVDPVIGGQGRNGAPVVYVPDASRSVSVAQSLLTPEQREQYIAEIATDYERLRDLHANKKALPMLSLAAARANKAKLDFTGTMRR